MSADMKQRLADAEQESRNLRSLKLRAWARNDPPEYRQLIDGMERSAFAEVQILRKGIDYEDYLSDLVEGLNHVPSFSFLQIAHEAAALAKDGE